MIVFLVGLGAYFIVELVTWGLPSKWLSQTPLIALLSLGAAVGLLYFMGGHRMALVVVYGLSGAALTLIIRKIVNLLSTIGDRIVKDIFSRRPY